MPFISICIPHYNRANYFLESLKSICSQSFRDFEICISDGFSTDGGITLVKNLLDAEAVEYKIFESPVNLRYDKNLRAAIDLSTGRYILLMGNDDAFSSKNALKNIVECIKAHKDVGVVITNYQDAKTKEVFKRAAITKNNGFGPTVASKSFRDYSFVSGIVLNGELSRSLSTDVCDGGEMYQMYLGAAITSMGKNLIYFSDICIDKDIYLPGEFRELGLLNLKDGKHTRYVANNLPMLRIFETVIYGISKGGYGFRDCSPYAFNVLRELYMFTYPYWILNFKRQFSPTYALGFIRNINPRKLISPTKIEFRSNILIHIIYIFNSACAFLMPFIVFKKIQPFLYRIAKFKS